MFSVSGAVELNIHVEFSSDYPGVLKWGLV